MDPIHEENGQWYYWDETWAWRTGPFDTEAEAREDLMKYCEMLNKPEQLDWGLPRKRTPGTTNGIIHSEPEDKPPLKASQIIAKLQELIAKHGDQEVYRDDSEEEYGCSIHTVEANIWGEHVGFRIGGFNPAWKKE